MISYKNQEYAVKLRLVICESYDSLHSMKQKTRVKHGFVDIEKCDQLIFILRLENMCIINIWKKYEATRVTNSAQYQ